MKKKKPSKNYLILVTCFFAVAFVVLGMNRILGQTAVNTVCEDKQGNLFVPRDKDGKIDGCGKHGEAVSFDLGGGDSVIGSGYVLFIKGTNLLTSEGKIWMYENKEGVSGWILDPNYTQIPENLVSSIIQWEGDSFLTNGGVYYKYDGDQGQWLPINTPTKTP